MSVDTLSIARELKAAKMPAPQAEAVASAIGYTVNESVATKSDLRELEERLAARFDAKIATANSKLLTSFIASQIALAAVIIAALKL